MAKQPDKRRGKPSQRQSHKQKQDFQEGHDSTGTRGVVRPMHEMQGQAMEMSRGSAGDAENASPANAMDLLDADTARRLGCTVAGTFGYDNENGFMLAAQHDQFCGFCLTT